MKIRVLYGTETGNAEMVADDIVDALNENFEAECQDMGEFSAAEISPEEFYILVCSTYGDGELPNTAQPLYDALNTEKPALNDTRFASFGLGDSFYETFNQGCAMMADKLKELGAQEIGEPGCHDASSGELPGDVAIEWLNKLLCHPSLSS